MIRLAASHPEWGLGFEEEVWFSRLARPGLSAWTAVGEPLPLEAVTVPRDDPDPKAVAGYGLLLRTAGALPEQVWLRFVAERPVSGPTLQFLDWVLAELAQAGKTALRLVWDNAGWHGSRAVRRWLKAHNRAVKQRGQGVRVVVCGLPSQSPWLNPLEPKWAHGKRQVVEPRRLLTAAELIARVYDAHGCPHLPLLPMPHEVS